MPRRFASNPEAVKIVDGIAKRRGMTIGAVLRLSLEDFSYELIAAGVVSKEKHKAIARINRESKGFFPVPTVEMGE